MSSIPQNHSDEKDLVVYVQRFFSKHHVGKLLAKCNGMKEKGVSPVSLLRYKLSNIFVGRSMYMQRRTGSFKEEFSKNTFYRFLNSLNSAKTNWLRFTSLLAADFVNNDIKGLTNDSRKMSSSLMTVFLTAPAARKQNWDQKFLITRICISKKDSECLL